MITTLNQFETIPAFTHIAGSNNGSCSNKGIAFDMLKAYDKIRSENHVSSDKMWCDLAWCNDDDEYLLTLQAEIAELITQTDRLPRYCTIELQDGEWLVLPYIDESLERFSDIPDIKTDDYILVVNDHGNVACMEWDQGEYKSIWDMV